MTSDFLRYLDQLKDLIARTGLERLFAAPLVTPDEAWFPDAWSQNLECVRRIVLRLAEYAGLPDFDVEVVGSPLDTDAEWMPAPVLERRANKERPIMLIAVHEGCAWFEVDLYRVPSRRHMVGVLAREMARAWREVHDIHVTRHGAEDECADLTAILLGLGILTCNAAYEYRMTRQGLTSSASWTHLVSGSLEVDDASGLLACWAKVKQLPDETILKHLGPTQADAFRKASKRWPEDELRERLGIPAGSRPAVEVRAGASEREFKPSRASRRVHETIERLVSGVGEDGGLVAEPLPFPIPVQALSNRWLAGWGRMSAAGTWGRSLVLVSDPEWATQAIVLMAYSGNAGSGYALGHVRDRDARDGRHLRDLLARAFRKDSPLRPLVAPGLPTFVRLFNRIGSFGLDQLESIFRALADEADPAEVTREAAWLESYGEHTLERLEFEREHGGLPDPPPSSPRGSKHWWQVVSAVTHAEDESKFGGFYELLLERRAGPPTPAAPPASSAQPRPEP